MCSSRNDHQQNKPVENRDGMKSRQLKTSEEKGILQRVIKGMNDVVISLTIINTR